MLLKCCTQYASKLGKQQWPQDQKRSAFIPVPKKAKSESCSVMSNSLRTHELYNPWNFPCQNTGMGSLSLLQGIFPTQGSNPGLPHCRRFLYQLSHKGSPGILQWVAYHFFSGLPPPRNWTRISCIAGRFFTNWALRGCLFWYSKFQKSIKTSEHQPVPRTLLV